MFSGCTTEESHEAKRWISGSCTSLTISLSLHFPFPQGPKSTPLPRKTKSVVARHVPEGQSGLAEARDALKMALNESWSYSSGSGFSKDTPLKKLNPKMEVWKMFLLFKGGIFRVPFHLPGCVSSFLVLEAVLTKNCSQQL